MSKRNLFLFLLIAAAFLIVSGIPTKSNPGPGEFVAGRNVNMVDGSWQVGSMMASQMGRFRPFAELSGYRTPIENVYLCSASGHFGGGIGRSSSYNCFKVVANDFGLEKIWEKKGRSW